MGRTFDRSVLIGIISVVALLVVNAGLAYRNTQKIHDEFGWVTHTHRVLALTGDVLLAIVDAETGQRGFLITGQEDFLQPYEAALTRLDGDLAELKNLTVENPSQQGRIGELEKSTARRLALLKEGIVHRRRNAEEARAFILARKGKDEMDAIRALVATMEREEKELLQQRERQANSAYELAVSTELMTTLMSFVLVCGFVLLLRRSLQARQNAAALLYEQREWFNTTLLSIGDAVIATDTRGTVTFMNAVAQNLTGWMDAEARGQSLEEVFDIVNEATRQRVPNPALRALQEGIVIGLANHSVLRAKHGAEIPIDDSAAPIRDSRGSVVGAVLIFRDISSRAKIDRDREESMALLDSVITNAPVSIALFDNERRFVRLNNMAARTDGIPREDHLGKTAMELFPTLGPMVELYLRQVAESGKAMVDMELSGETPAAPGRLRNWIASFFPVRGRDGRLLALGMTALEITDRKRVEAALKEADRHKNEFLAMLAHELRNPMAPIQNSLELLRMIEPGRQPLTPAIDMIERQVGHLVRLVDDLLDVSRISRGKITVEKKPVDLVGIVAEAIETTRPSLRGRHHDFHVALPSHSLRVEGDLTRLNQIVLNLLNNAVKYTPEHGNIWVSLKQENDDAVVRVRDDGVGINSMLLPHVFDLFVQADRTLDRSQGGLGIGLTLVRNLVELHGGKAEAQSEGLGRGSEFIVRLPLLAETAPEVGGANGLEPAKRTPPPRRILVVEDFADLATSLATLLEMQGNKVRIVNDGAVALQAAAEYRPDVILLDIGLPGLDGYAVARALRAQPTFDETVLIAVTGYGSESDRLKSVQAGFQAHLVKPVRFDTLKELLASLTIR